MIRQRGLLNRGRGGFGKIRNDGVHDGLSVRPAQSAGGVTGWPRLRCTVRLDDTDAAFLKFRASPAGETPPEPKAPFSSLRFRSYISCEKLAGNQCPQVELPEPGQIHAE
jgi:hypothetical protein